MAVVNPVETQKTNAETEAMKPPQKLKFKSEEERMEAMKSVASKTRPPNMNPDLWQNQVDNEVQAINEAEIITGIVEPAKVGAQPDNSVVAPQVPEPAKVDEGKLEYGATVDGIVLPKTEQGALRAYVNNENYILLAKKRAEDKERLANEAIARAEQAEKQLKELSDRMSALERAGTPVTPKQEQRVNVAEDKQAEIARLQVEINNWPTDDRFNASHLEKMQKLQNLQAEQAIELRSLISTFSQKMIDIEKNQGEYTRKQQEAEENRKKEEEREKLIKKQKEEQEKVEQGYKEIDDFASSKPELKLDKKYAEKNMEYQLFGRDIYYIINQKDPTTLSEIDDAVLRYMSDDLVKRECQKHGIREPENLDKFLQLTQIHMKYLGWNLDPNTRAWVEQKNRLTGNRVSYNDMDEAYAVIKDKSGFWFKKMAERENAAAIATQAAIAGNSGKVPVMPNAGGANVVDPEKVFTPEEAAKIVEEMTPKMSEIIKASWTNPNEPRLQILNKCMRTLGLEPIDPNPNFKPIG